MFQLLDFRIAEFEAQGALAGGEISMDDSRLRVELIETICRLPADQLAQADQALRQIVAGPVPSLAASTTTSVHEQL